MACGCAHKPCCASRRSGGPAQADGALPLPSFFPLEAPVGTSSVRGLSASPNMRLGKCPPRRRTKLAACEGFVSLWGEPSLLPRLGTLYVAHILTDCEIKLTLLTLPASEHTFR